MDTTLRWSKRAHRSKLEVAHRVRMAESDLRLREQYPEEFAKFEQRQSSPSAVMQHYGWLMNLAFTEGIAGDYTRRRMKYKRLADKRFRDSRMRRYGYLYANPRKHQEDKMFHEHAKDLKARSFVWKCRVELKQWKIEEAFYNSMP